MRVGSLTGSRLPKTRLHHVDCLINSDVAVMFYCLPHFMLLVNHDIPNICIRLNQGPGKLALQALTSIHVKLHDISQQIKKNELHLRGEYLDPKGMRMGSEEGSTMRNFIVCTVHLI